MGVFVLLVLKELWANVCLSVCSDCLCAALPTCLPLFSTCFPSKNACFSSFSVCFLPFFACFPLFFDGFSSFFTGFSLFFIEFSSETDGFSLFFVCFLLFFDSVLFLFASELSSEMIKAKLFFASVPLLFFLLVLFLLCGLAVVFLRVISSSIVPPSHSSFRGIMYPSSISNRPDSSTTCFISL